MAKKVRSQFQSSYCFSIKRPSNRMSSRLSIVMLISFSLKWFVRCRCSSSIPTVLVFSQYVKTCRLLEKQIAERFSVRPLVFEGSLSPDRRDNIIRAFDRNPARQVLILSLKAGGVGLNLIAASNVIFFDRWWNPAVEEQATDRAVRFHLVSLNPNLSPRFGCPVHGNLSPPVLTL